ncbi:DNA replication/repair protein RecF [Cryobacterium sp. LW097]|uniref:DNA replication/repair protein RecF n=1 Tax=unclassified Cryobacterium TaxID=2649013 RepID=UPI000B4C5B6C|nr:MULTISPECIES: DNA replication/repair protein RecF [unclassified Cryobacterium]ASD20699.1 DNA replication/repair protein RecF [Cryobacterium sp. LW097]TFC50612.1 DNA replication/repair protein RecF [Cryobacterium sp. TMB3-1-2]TFC74226.1 DNA replication/repair protein RecF [Cryobacterium sp. TMB3-10]TFC74830.1 DNA replication/repair protein RecF [Cryobacterium sp. TMB3-15]TFD41072.1 DNA replication/repair protein RecF [Cryobacterium sp. TMB3-12]
MRVTHLSLTDFRNYAQAEVPFGPGPNLIVGRNGQGKTNLVEALGFLSTLSSHRVSQTGAMVRSGAESAIIRARLEYNGRDILAEVQINRSGLNRAQINRSVIKTRELPRYFSSVLFAPEDLALVRGDPSGRRRFLDQLLVLRSPRLSGVLADYDRVLKQRNTLLKSARASGLKTTQLGTLDIWDERLVALGSEIIDARADLVAELMPPLQKAYKSVAGADHGPNLVASLSILGADEEADETASPAAASPSASSGSATADTFRTALAGLRRKELDRGMTLAGPHRDDLVFELNNLPAKGYASHGESWSFALALKLASAELLRRDSSSGDPVLILDDVFAELDQSRRRRLAEAVTGYEQVLITAAVFQDVPAVLAAHAIHIHAGAVVAAPEAESGTVRG